MNLSTTVLGAATVHTLEARGRAAVLTIGRDTFTRRDLAKVACWSFTAAANLSARLAALDVADTRALFEHVPPTALALPRLGAISLAVLGAAFELKGYGGDRPLEAWVQKHARGADPMVTFATIKKRDAKERAAEHAAARSRHTTRRRTAHRLRVARFTARQDKAS